MTDWAVHHAYLIPILPLLGFLLNGILGRRLGRQFVHIVGCGSVFLSLLIALGCIGWVTQHPTEQFEMSYTWIPGFSVTTALGDDAPFVADWGFLIDALSAVMLFVVCFIGFLIHVYSTGYMAHEEGFWRFFAYLNLFMAMMLTLILANNMLMLFVGWEGVGLCSYLLIGFYYERKEAGDAGKKAFVVNRIGDFGFALGMLFCMYYFGSIRFTELVPMATAMGGANIIPEATFTLICLLLFLGACGKSAQIPLYVWLPDAMAGPTPVSALIHAATMVTSGIYMIARLNGLFTLAPDALNVIAVVGGVTALWAATIALTQTDIKKVLAYSTVSQLGYMFLAIGVGAYSAAVFHVMTHAFFKACLFLGSGSVIHAMSGEQDIRRMGGLDKHIPHTYRTFWISCWAIAGVFPLAGFFSKDEILWKAFGYGHYGVWLLGFITAGMTAFYMFRLLHVTFDQTERFDDHARSHLHESPPSMTVPLWILAAGAIVAGWVGIPEALGGSNHWHHWLNPVVADTEITATVHHGHNMERALAVISVLWALAAIFAARLMYRNETAAPRQLSQALAPLYKASLNKWYVDEIYDALIINPIKKMTALMDTFDRWIIDGAVNGVRHLTIGLCWLSKHIDRIFVDGLVNLVGGTVKASAAAMRRVQTGSLQNYGYYFILGLFGMVCVFLIYTGGAA